MGRSVVQQGRTSHGQSIGNVHIRAHSYSGEILPWSDVMHPGSMDSQHSVVVEVPHGSAR